MTTPQDPNGNNGHETPEQLIARAHELLAEAKRRLREREDGEVQRPVLRIIQGGGIIAAVMGVAAWLVRQAREHPMAAALAGAAATAATAATVAVAPFVGPEDEPGGPAPPPPGAASPPPEPPPEGDEEDQEDDEENGADEDGGDAEAEAGTTVEPLPEDEQAVAPAEGGDPDETAPDATPQPGPPGGEPPGPPPDRPPEAPPPAREDPGPPRDPPGADVQSGPGDSEPYLLCVDADALGLALDVCL